MSEYRVVSVVSLDKKKYKISLEGTKMVTISLYPSELRRFNIKEGNLVSDDSYREIEQILYKRGKERALYLLKSSDKTAYQMRKKLKEGYYPEEIIDNVLKFLERYGYIDDNRFAIQFIHYNQNKKSYARIKNDLRIKGIEKDIIENAFLRVEEEYVDTYSEDGENANNPQIEMIRSFIKKKYKADMDGKEQNKIIMSLVRKGFLYDDVMSELRNFLSDI